jgi:hypothetical protein
LEKNLYKTLRRFLTCKNLRRNRTIFSSKFDARVEDLRRKINPQTCADLRPKIFPDEPLSRGRSQSPEDVLRKTNKDYQYSVISQKGEATLKSANIGKAI